METKNYSYYSYSSRNSFSNETKVQEEARRCSYELRLCSQTYQTYMLGGVVLMLTFTYNNENIPYCYNPRTMEYVKAFDRGHVLGFLNRLKVNHYRKNKGEYKYFWCMEYGSKTKRPHYHALFFLTADVDRKKFIDTCRKQWLYGYMFPSPGCQSYHAAELRSPSHGAQYAVKYVMKDLSFYQRSDLVRLLDWQNYCKVHNDEAEVQRISRYMPKIYQSNGIGENLVEQLYNDFEKVMKNGLYNHLTQKYKPCPRYVLNKYFYKNVLAFDGRTGKNNQKLYDRILKVDYCYYEYYKLVQLNNLRQRYADTLKFCDIEKFKEKTEFLRRLDYLKVKTFEDNDIDSISYQLAIWRTAAKNYSINMLEHINTLEDFFSLPVYKKYLSLQSDVYTRYVEQPQRTYTPLLTEYICKKYELAEYFNCLTWLSQLLDKKEEERTINRVKQYEDNRKIKELNSVKKYPEILC